jgi:hypothetical protein
MPASSAKGAVFLDGFDVCSALTFEDSATEIGKLLPFDLLDRMSRQRLLVFAFVLLLRLPNNGCVRPGKGDCLSLAGSVFIVRTSAGRNGRQCGSNRRPIPCV